MNFRGLDNEKFHKIPTAIKIPILNFDGKFMIFTKRTKKIHSKFTKNLCQIQSKIHNFPFAPLMECKKA